MSDDKYVFTEVFTGITVDKASDLADALEQRMNTTFAAMIHGDTGGARELTDAQKAREPGFYWVKFQDEWSVEEWRGGEWLMTGTEETTREDVGEIGPRVEPPQ